MINRTRKIYRLGRRYLGSPAPANLYYVVPGVNWVLDVVGQHITSGVSARFGLPSHLVVEPYWLVDHILHYGSLWAFLGHLGPGRLGPHNERNTLVVTVFHGDPEARAFKFSEGINRFLEYTDDLSRVVTASTIMEERLLQWGVPPEKLVRIPLGVDLSIFKPASAERRAELRRKLGVPEDAVCIGSFQKDGSGWGDGMEPKLPKGPDIFLKVIENLAKQYKVFVLLSGPSRGFVRQGLDALGVPYYHELLSNQGDLPPFYQCLDLYLITSREEGGPQALLEAPACGVPVVSTRVGMAPDTIEHGESGFLVELEDLDKLTGYASDLIEQPDLRKKFIVAGSERVRLFSWDDIADRYYHEVYAPLLNEIDWKK